MLALVYLAGTALISVNIVALRVLRGDAATSVSVRIDAADASTPPSVRVLGRVETSEDAEFARSGAVFSTNHYVKRLIVAVDDTTLRRVRSVVVTIGDASFTYTARQLREQWIEERLDGGGSAWRAPPSVTATRSRLPAVRRTIINWRGDEALLSIAWRAVGLAALATGIAVFAIALMLVASSHVRRPLFESRAWLLLSVAVPFLMVAAISSHHETDIGDFEKWAEAWQRSPRDLYLSSACNYPILGSVLSVVPLSLIHRVTSDRERGHFLFREYLAVFDALALLLTARLLSALRVRRASLWILLVSVLPSTWAGASVWGQIEGIGQVLFLATILALVFALRDLDEGRGHAIAWFNASAIGVASLLLCKQLLVFGIVPILAFAVLVALRLVRADRVKGSLGVITWIALAAVGTFAWDLWLRTPPPFRSHLEYIWLGGGSGKAKVLSGNGFNLWMTAGRDASSSAYEAIGGLVPAVAGTSLFLAYVLALFLRAWSARHAFTKRGAHAGVSSGAGAQRAVVSFLLAFALVQLAMSVFLTGTHERYLYHFYPFALVALLGARATGRTTISGGCIAGLVACATLYGLFVVHAPLPPMLFFAKNNVFVGAIHLVLLVILTRTWSSLLDEGPDLAMSSPAELP